MKNLLDFATFLRKIKMNVGVGTRMWETAEGFYVLTDKNDRYVTFFTQVYGNLNEPNYTYRLAKKDAENFKDIANLAAKAKAKKK